MVRLERTSGVVVGGQEESIELRIHRALNPRFKAEAADFKRQRWRWGNRQRDTTKVFKGGEEKSWLVLCLIEVYQFSNSCSRRSDYLVDKNF